MITFRQFIQEEADGKKPEFKSASVDSAIKILNTYCKDALWMLEKDSPLYRGDGMDTVKANTTGFMTVDTSATVRKSQNTSNYYTVILDNHPEMKGFPKRSRSFIGSTDLDTSSSFADSDNHGNDLLYVMIPYDGVKIGMCTDSDMWGTSVRLYGLDHTIDRMNREFRDAGILPTYEGFVKYAAKLKAKDKKTLQYFKEVFPNGNPDTFLEDIWKAYSPTRTKLKSYTTATLPRNIGAKDQEVWVGGKVMLITMNMWKNLRDAYRKSRKATK